MSAADWYRVGSENLDRLARAAAHQLRAGRAQVCLFAGGRRLVAGRAGPPVAHTFCHLVEDAGGAFLVSDARADERVSNHPAVREGVIAYAGFPLRGERGELLGVFCVIDEQPRDWEPRELLLVEDLAAAAGTEITLRATVRELRDRLAAATRDAPGFTPTPPGG